MMPPRLRPTAPGRGRTGRRRPLVLVFLAVLLVVASACGSTTPGAGPSSESTRPSTPAQIAIVSPTGGATVPGPTIHVALTLAGATLAPASSTSGVDPTVGHIHLSLDGSIASMTSSLSQDLSVDKPGPHILMAEFVANDHQPFFPRKTQTISFTTT